MFHLRQDDARLVTVANSGIGFHTALGLVRKGAEIIIPARTQAKAEEAMRRIRKEVPAAKLIPDILDLTDLGSVFTFAERFLKRFAGASLDPLINNTQEYAPAPAKIPARAQDHMVAQ
jgi:NAD(P)-dependent dehydrogenase (short-subunit alcohol dehydrogenase family)